MVQLLLFGGLIAIGLVMFLFSSRVRVPMGVLLLLVGISVFAIRLQHAGPYDPPEGGNLLAAVLALALGLALMRPWPGPQAGKSLVIRLILAASPLILFFGLYGTLAELEEVVVLRVTDAQGDSNSLRLWIVDYDGVSWVTMPRRKADESGLSDTQAELLRQGETQCVIVKRYEAHADVDRSYQLSYEKYAVQRAATALGIFPRTASPDSVTLRLDPCPA